MNTDHMKPSALGHLRILDLADERGMFCSKLLADMGADVIRIEKPCSNNPGRKRGPFLRDPANIKTSLFYWYHNTNKRGITLNLRRKQGRAILERLIQTADAIVETYPEKQLHRLGLSWDTLHIQCPSVIVASITDFGRTGPRKDFISCDLVSSALGGQMYISGQSDGPPIKPYGEQTHLVASLFGAIGILLAIQQRHMSNTGQHVDISIHECTAATIEPVNVQYFYEGIITKRQGPLHWNNAFRIFPCRDGYILISLFQNWDTLIEWLDSEGMAQDLIEQKWQQQETRLHEVGHIIEVIEQWTKRHSVDELVEQGQLMHFPWAPVQSIEQVARDPQLKSRGFFTEVYHPEFGKHFTYPGAPYKLSESPWQLHHRAPLLGEHNTAIYCQELGLSQQELNELKVKDII
ncbi:MAG: CoA transferase [Chloroflexota bacterium]|nr:CoA transferase [Chloroflexota bacterium]